MCLEFVPQPYERGLKFRFPYLPNTTVIGGFIMLSAYPTYTAFSRLSSECVTAVAANDLFTERGALFCKSAWLIPFGKYFLSIIKNRFLYYRFMRSLNIILFLFAAVPDRFEWEGKPYKVYMMAAANKFLRIYYAKVNAVLNA